jgi:hypothetical protein
MSGAGVLGRESNSLSEENQGISEFPGSGKGSRQVLHDQRVIRIYFDCRPKNDFRLFKSTQLGQGHTDGDSCVVVTGVEPQAFVERDEALTGSPQFR